MFRKEFISENSYIPLGIYVPSSFLFIIYNDSMKLGHMSGQLFFCILLLNIVLFVCCAWRARVETDRVHFFFLLGWFSVFVSLLLFYAILLFPSTYSCLINFFIYPFLLPRFSVDILITWCSSSSSSIFSLDRIMWRLCLPLSSWLLCFFKDNSKWR